jgi:hypothetical protein
MSGIWSWWGFGLVAAVAVTVSLFHLGMNAGGAIASLVLHAEHFFATPLTP